MSDGWVALDKSLVRTMKEIRRPYSHVEAMFSHSVNVNCGKPWSIKGYAEVWQWDRKKVRKFIEEIPTEAGYGACKKGMNSGYQIRLITLCEPRTEQGHNRDTIGTQQGHAAGSNINELQVNRDTIGTEQGHNRDTMRDPIINNKNNNKNNTKEKRVAFAPPTEDDVRKYCTERKNDVSPQRFVDFYASKGWMIGKTKMKDWQAAIRTWEGKENGKNRIAAGKGNGFAEARKSGETNWLE